MYTNSDTKQQSPLIEPDTYLRLFNRRLSTQDEDILLFAGQSPRKDDWPDISAAYSQKHGYRSPEACRKRYYILEPRNRDYPKRKATSSQGRRSRQPGATQMAAVNGLPLPYSAGTRSTTQHVLPVEQQFLSAEPVVSDYQPSQPVTYTAITSDTSATGTFNDTSFADTHDKDQPRISEQWTQDYSNYIQDDSERMYYEDCGDC